jgi:hypothetical protein
VVKPTLLTAAACLLAVWGLAYVLTPTDSTDAGMWDRSGMSLHVDDLTGCHYLSVIFGGLTPRVDAGGKHVCE